MTEGAKGEGRVFRHARRGRAGLRGRRRSSLHAAIKYRIARAARAPRPTATAAQVRSRPPPAGVFFNQALPDDFGSSTTSVEEARHRRDRRRLADHYAKAVVAEQPRRHQGPRLPLRGPVGPHDLDRRRQDAAREGGDPRPLREGSREGRDTSSSGASSPTASGARRKSRSGPTPPTRCARPWRRACRPSSSTPST